MRNLEEMYDIIGNIHGHADELIELLERFIIRSASRGYYAHRRLSRGPAMAFSGGYGSRQI